MRGAGQLFREPIPPGFAFGQTGAELDADRFPQPRSFADVGAGRAVERKRCHRRERLQGMVEDDLKAALEVAIRAALTLLRGVLVVFRHFFFFASAAAFMHLFHRVDHVERTRFADEKIAAAVVDRETRIEEDGTVAFGIAMELQAAHHAAAVEGAVVELLFVAVILLFQAQIGVA